MDMVISQINAMTRTMVASDLVYAHELTQKLKWPHTLEDWQDIHSLGTSLVMEVDGQVIGTACVVPQGDYASVGLIVIADEYQGNGFGKRMMNEIMATCPSDIHFYLTATEMGKPLYKKLGFSEYAVIEQYQNVIDAANISVLKPGNDVLLRESCAADYPQLTQLMNQSTGMDRHQLANKIFDISDKILVLEQHKTLVGFAALRRFGRGWSIGPVIAENSQNALSLISHHLLNCNDKFVRLDIVVDQEISQQLLAWGLNKVDTVSQMVKGEKPVVITATRQFCLMTQAMG